MAADNPEVNKEELQELEDTGLDFTRPVLAIKWEDYKMEYQQEIAERINRVHNTFNGTQIPCQACKPGTAGQHSYLPPNPLLKIPIGRHQRELTRNSRTSQQMPSYILDGPEHR